MSNGRIEAVGELTGAIASTGELSASLGGGSLTASMYERGPQGEPGPANELTIGEVTEGEASATITGVSPHQVLNLTIPRGRQGATGPQGPTGQTGATGSQGPRGERGERGETGPQGEQGIQGIQGIQGVRGLQGEPGRDGAIQYTAGTNIIIEDNVISSTGGGLVDDVKVNGSSVVDDKVALITVPTKNSDLTNDTNYLSTGDIVNTTTSTATDKTLSANMGKELQDQITNLKSRGRYLSIWNSTTGRPMTEPTTLPYEYHTGDYYIVGTTGSTNYRPNGTQYTGSASTTIETGTVKTNDTYYFDGTNWGLLDIGQVASTFATLGGSPYDNSNLANALNSKANSNDVYTKSATDTLLNGKVDKVSGKGLSTNDYTTTEKNKLAGIDMNTKQDKITSTNKLSYSLLSGTPSIPMNTSDLTNDSGFITSSYHDGSKQDKLTSGTNIKTVNGNSLLGSGNITISGGGSADGVTTRLNTDNETEVIGIYTTQNSARKIWEGTKAQYDAIVTKEADTYYYITDDGVGYASSTQVGGLKVRLDGTTLYIRNDGADA